MKSKKQRKEQKELRARIYRPSARGERAAARRAHMQATATLLVLLVIAAAVAFAVVFGRRAQGESAPPEPTEKLAARFTVVIDPGHGGNDPGSAIDTETCEADYVLSVAYAVRQRMESQDCAVIFTHEGQEASPTDSQRAQACVDAGGDCMICLHTCGAAGAEYSLLTDATEQSALLAQQLGQPRRQTEVSIPSPAVTACVRLMLDPAQSAEQNAARIADGITAYRKEIGK